MPFEFSGAELPLATRACRAVVWTQAGLTILGGVFILLTATLLGSSTAILFHGGALSGGVAAALGGVTICAGVALVLLGAALGRRAPWALAALLGVEALLAALVLLRAFDLSPATVLNLLLCVAAVALLVAPDTRRALAGRTTTA
jgi:hypothetical protein